MAEQLESDKKALLREKKSEWRKMIPEMLKKEDRTELKEREKKEKRYLEIDDSDPEKSIYVKKGGIRKAAIPAVTAKTQLCQNVEDILAEELGDLYVNLSAEEKDKVKAAGEETASRLAEMIETLKTKAKEVLRLIKNWLMIIPKINKYFVEQQAKIKTDKIMALARKHQRDNKL